MRYERLTKQGNFYTDSEAIDRLWELEDKIENGTLVELPCEVGDTVYVIWRDERYGECVVEVTVTRISFTRYATCIDTDCGSYPIGEIGRTIFFTKAEAEEQLKESGCEAKEVIMTGPIVVGDIPEVEYEIEVAEWKPVEGEV